MKNFNKGILKRLAFFFIGLIALIWFLIRVIPKPSRAMYPCQRAAFPVASAFVIWLAGIIGSYLSFKKAKQYFQKSKYGFAILFVILSIIILGITQLKSSNEEIFAGTRQPEMHDLFVGSESIQPQATVSIVRSDKAKAEDIDSLEIYDMVKRAVEMAGGFDDLIHDNSTVVLKPNLLTAAVVDDDFNAVSILPQKVNSVTTDYRIIQAVVNLVREKNPHGKVYVMDGSAIGNVRDNMEKMGWFKVTGVDEFFPLDESCGAWRDKAAKELVKISLPASKNLYNSQNEYYLNKIYYEADVLISIPVLKTHSITAMTGAVKNVGIGATPVNIYGSAEGHPWRYDVIDHGSESNNFAALHNWIHDFYLCKPVDFAIMDALTGMQYGPLSHINNPYYPLKKNTRCILASRDPIALDAIASLIMQVDPSKVRHLVTLHNDSLGCNDPKYIRVNGIRVDQVKDRYANLATYARYTDFTPPTVSLNSYKIIGDSLYVSLEADNQVVKVEIKVDDQFLEPIFTNNFKNITAKLEKPVNDPSQIKILAYDKFLNCTALELKTTDVKTGNIPNEFKLKNNYPNPFNPETNIGYQLPTRSHVELKIFDIQGRELKTLVNKEQNAGEYEVKFNGSNLGSGIYLCRIKAGRFTQTHKMLLLK